jgi:predicted aspartyl protease
MSTTIKKFVVALSAPALVLWATLAGAHHSAAQFDFSKRVTVEGTVKEFNWRFEGHSASHFYRAGYTRDMVKAGDKIAILIAPRHDGTDGGFIQAFTVNGKTVGFGGLSPVTGKAENASESGSSAPSN